MQFLGSFAKLRKATITCIMPVCLSVHMKQIDYQLADFQAIWYTIIFRKSVEKIQVTSKSGNSNSCFTWRPVCVCDIMSPSSSKNEKYCRLADKCCRENQHTQIIFSNFFSEIVTFMRLCEKIRYSQTGYRGQYNKAHARCVLDTHILRICNTFAFPCQL
jgi:hypothetical protein